MKYNADGSLCLYIQNASPPALTRNPTGFLHRKTIPCPACRTRRPPLYSTARGALRPLFW
ncbi:MAG: hypothetical protein AB1598_00935 [Thermodesulfobacteriota bacterium]